MRKLKAEGKVQVYTGNGKGKTTASFGLALRAAGHGLHVFIMQFMKKGDYGEVIAVKGIKNIHVEQCGTGSFILEASEKDKREAMRGFEAAKEAIFSGKYDIVILDEICVAIKYGLVPEDYVIDLIKNKPKNVELVLTGRWATKNIIMKADLVTEMVDVKHPYQKGLGARKGIEY